MRVAEKIRHLRLVEGHRRGLGREMTQKELVSALSGETDKGISQPYLSQLERGQRKHLTNTTRRVLAKFFQVHPGYLVDDPDDSHLSPLSSPADREEKLDLWLIGGAERFSKDPALAESLLQVAQHEDTRGCLLLLADILKAPGLIGQLSAAVKQQPGPSTSDL